MKKSVWIPLVAVLAVIVILVIALISGYNSLVDLETKVEQQQATIQTQLQRRADLIPNFVATVKGYSDYEQSTLQAVTEARAAVGKATNASELENAEEQLVSATRIWVNAVTEAYPVLASSAQFIALQDELAGTENRIGVSRKDYNAAAKEYNAAIRKFPTSLVAGIFGFTQKDYFRAADGAQDVPNVEF
jgi:LemA protein